MAYGDLNRTTTCDKILHDKAFNIAKSLKLDGYQRSLASMVYKIFDKESSVRGIKNENMSDQQFAEKLRKPIIRKFNKETSTLSFYRKYFGRRSSRYAIDKQI